MTRVILSTTILLGEGVFEAIRITRDQAMEWIRTNNPRNFCGHASVRVLGIKPAEAREQCEGYDQALCVTSKKRLEFGREYTLDEMEAAGVEFTLITRCKNLENHLYQERLLWKSR